ncbi:hypothetical protein H9655_21090 [Cytobacillus sp. Sa5YUA1]|uniref:Uncharacterized protein n=1 Tax=Cytobacillus stercorigallinarum TaxID=2762240 RepID=A0ABR8QVH2_9BACI|nr:hypothetical protein [Cytobacillus stercorigallinarum]MBD7939542.1 hypothetical protein [Cytobacillus stercorigallinarum]
MENQQIYLLSADGGNAAGNIYEYSDQDAKILLEKGKAVKVDYPKLKSYETEINSLVKRYKEQRDALKENPRYADNEAEREYQLQELRRKLDEDVAAQREDYAVELEATYREAATKAFSFETSEEGVKFADAVSLRLDLGIGQDVADMLKVAIASASDAEKVGLLTQWPKLSQKLEGNGVNRVTIQDIEADLKKSTGLDGAALQFKILGAIKDSQNPATAYTTMLAVEKIREAAK